MRYKRCKYKDAPNHKMWFFFDSKNWELYSQYRCSVLDETGKKVKYRCDLPRPRFILSTSSFRKRERSISLSVRGIFGVRFWKNTSGTTLQLDNDKIGKSSKKIYTRLEL